MARGNVPELKIVPRPDPVCCEAAGRFRTWTSELLSSLAPEGSSPTPVAINQTKVRLLDQFWLERGDTEVTHRDRLRGPESQPCVLSIFIESVAKIRDIEGRVAPPVLTAPPKPVKKPGAKPEPEPYLPAEMRLPKG